ncbi:MAG: EscU/YscU/HrcU family type III secretion system export apparatus switch protein [Thermoguttaceae bacterium]|nr:EscU/YscU/HrcU family type III secretion system export apparatus switch protein [Thermoguttaceae bacterium]
MSDHENRTEVPTIKRINQARAEGKFPAVGLFTGTLLFFAMLLIVELSAAGCVERFLVWSRRLRQMTADLTPDSLVNEAARGFLPFLPLMAALASAALFLPPMTAWLTRGWAFLPEKTVPDFSRLLPKLGAFFSLDALWRLLLAAVQILGTIWLVTFWIRRVATGEEYLSSASGEWPGLFRRFLFPLTIRLALFSIGVALADLFFQRWKFQRDLRMTLEEVRREQQEEERKSPPRRN